MKKIGIGYENYKEFIDDDMYYVDKTWLINDIVEKGGKVTLFTRPRRFGKTLALSMLRTFFELEYDWHGNIIDKRRYFEGKKIMGAPDEILSMMGQYPVIKLSLKSAKQGDFLTAFKKLRDEIIYEFKRHSYLWVDDVLPREDRALLEEISIASNDSELFDKDKQMLTDYGMADRIPEAKKWYNGYLFGDKEIYNPWSIIKYVDSIAISGMKFPEPYWANTSSNAIIKDMVWQADDEMKRELDKLISGGTIEKKIHEDITYDDIHESEDNLWNFLFFTGYMKKVSERSAGEDGAEIYLTMKIPNVEIRSIYKNQISTWFEKQVKNTDRGTLNKAVLEGDTAGIENYVNDLLAKIISLYDSDESFYHGFFLSLLYSVPNYGPKSNREEGDGRPDIVLYPDRRMDPAIIFEIKVRKKYNEMEDGLSEAYDQIRTKKYEEGVLEDGYMGVKSYGVCFCKKSCIVGKYMPGAAYNN